MGCSMGDMEEEVKDHSLALFRVKVWFMIISNQGKVCSGRG